MLHVTLVNSLLGFELPNRSMVDYSFRTFCKFSRLCGDTVSLPDLVNMDSYIPPVRDNVLRNQDYIKDIKQVKETI